MAMRDFDLLWEAARLAFKRKDMRSHYVGAIGWRADGTRVRAHNSPAPEKEPSIHAEARLVHKLDVGATVWVARMSRIGQLALAKPCPNCERALRGRGVRRVYYSTGPDSFEFLDFG